MQRQGSFAEAEYGAKKKQTRRDKFLAEMDAAVQWSRLVERLALLYPKGERGRPPVGLEWMLRVAARNDKRPDAQSRAMFGADYQPEPQISNTYRISLFKTVW
jgi:hypothetical protein